jgi:hypothetical protein
MVPASIRTNNPGAMWPGPSATRFGATGFQNLADGNKIAIFDDPVNGAAAQFDLLSRKYTGKQLRDLIRMWSGGNSSGAYANQIAKTLPGVSMDTVVTKEMLSDPSFAIPFARTAAQWEAGRSYPLSNEQWAQAHRMALGGPIPSPGAGPHANVAMNGGVAGVSPTGDAGKANTMQAIQNLGRTSTNGQIDPQTGIGGVSGAMLTDYGRQSSPPTVSTSPAPLPPPSQAPAGPQPHQHAQTADAYIGAPQSWAAQSFADGTAYKSPGVNTASPKYKNALINMLGGIF